jgi:hypothetical protein
VVSGDDGAVVGQAIDFVVGINLLGQLHRQVRNLPPGTKISGFTLDDTHSWATPEESREFITGRYRRAWAHSDATIDALALDAIGHVPWWPPDQNEVTLHHILVRVATETSRHAGQADIIRELIDGTAGLTSESPNMPSGDQAWWQSYRDQVEHAAQEAAKLS